MSETEQEAAVREMQSRAYLAVQTLQLLPAAVRHVLSPAVNRGEKKLGVGQEGVSPLQVPPQLLLHVKVTVAHLKELR